MFRNNNVINNRREFFTGGCVFAPVNYGRNAAVPYHHFEMFQASDQDRPSSHVLGYPRLTKNTFRDPVATFNLSVAVVRTSPHPLPSNYVCRLSAIYIRHPDT
jgi:hypothetical protein